MAKHEGGFFWGVLVGAITTAIAGCVALTKSFRSTPAAGGSAKSAAPSARKPKTGARLRVRTGKNKD